MESVSLYSEARNEYLKQLSTWLVPQLVEFFRRHYDRLSATEGKRVMAEFQNWCAEVPRWNRDVIDANVNELLDSCKCDYIEDLMTAVFIAHTKMLTAVRVNNRSKKLQITLPKLDHFLHRVFIECARAFWKAPFLFADNVSLIERQKNLLQAETMSVEALSGAVRSLLPIKNILRDNLIDASESESSSSSSDEEEKRRKKKRKHKTPKYVSPPSSDDSEPETVVQPKGGSAPGGSAPIVEPIVEPIAEPSILDDIVEEPVEPTPEFTVVPVTVAAAPVAAAPVAAAPVAAAPVAAAPVAATVAPVAPVAAIDATGIKPVSVSKPPKAVELIKDETTAPVEEQVFIDTEPTVKFSPYEMVFDDNLPNVSEMRYAPKMSIEEMPDKPPYEPIYAEDEDAPPPRLSFGNAEVSLSGTDIEELGDDAMALNDGDFETL